MKIYYNFVKREFGLQPTGPCFSSETNELFNEQKDTLRYYPDCHFLEIEGDHFKLHVIQYEDEQRDYLRDDERSKRYFRQELDDYLYNPLYAGYKPILVKRGYSMFGYDILEKTYVFADNIYFMTTEWRKK
jgi:hypothetical protein